MSTIRANNNFMVTCGPPTNHENVGYTQRSVRLISFKSANDMEWVNRVSSGRKGQKSMKKQEIMPKSRKKVLRGPYSSFEHGPCLVCWLLL